jgi:hypothetical protein
MPGGSELDRMISCTTKFEVQLESELENLWLNVADNEIFTTCSAWRMAELCPA